MSFNNLTILDTQNIFSFCNSPLMKIRYFSDEVDLTDFVNNIESNSFETKLELVESYAEENNLLANEYDVSESFKEMISESVDCEESFYNDEPMVSESFSNYIDSLCSDGQIHREQVNNYEFIG